MFPAAGAKKSSSAADSSVALTIVSCSAPTDGGAVAALETAVTWPLKMAAFCTALTVPSAAKAGVSHKETYTRANECKTQCAPSFIPTMMFAHEIELRKIVIK